jgi:hypothetical protein
MVSYSFYIPDGKESRNFSGYIENPVKIPNESISADKLEFDSDKGNREAFEYLEENTNFSIVYNK